MERKCQFTISEDAITFILNQKKENFNDQPIGLFITDRVVIGSVFTILIRLESDLASSSGLVFLGDFVALGLNVYGDTLNFNEGYYAKNIHLSIKLDARNNPILHYQNADLS